MRSDICKALRLCITAHHRACLPSPYILRYKEQHWAKQPGGLVEQSAEGQLRELEARLARSKADWKLLVGHHPPRSNGEHGNNPEIVTAFEPLIQKYGIQAVFAGHDHSLEHLFHSEGGLRYHTIVSGAGSLCDRHFIGKRDSQWQYPWSGFVAAHISGDQLQIDFFTLLGGTTPAYSTAIKPTL